jgi:rhodanese-related sulfurtransferase
MALFARRRLASAAIIAALAIAGVIAWAPHLVSGWPDPADPDTTLAQVEAAVSRNIPVPEMSSPTLREAIAGADTVMFDVREPEEFEQSHIAGASRIDPGLSTEAFAARFGNDIRGKTVIFYCAVGVRSGTMLKRVTSVLANSGAKAGYNLRGGIFRWYANGGPVVSDAGPAQSVHNYDNAWGKLLARTVAAGRP